MRLHLVLQFVQRVYPMSLDETCFFLAIDFDKSGWKEDVGMQLDHVLDMILSILASQGLKLK